MNTTCISRTNYIVGDQGMHVVGAPAACCGLRSVSSMLLSEFLVAFVDMMKSLSLLSFGLDCR